MPIDPSIALGYKAPTFESPVNQLAQLLQVQSAQQQNQLGQMKMDEYQRGVDRTNRLQGLLGSFKADAPADEQVSALTRGGFLPEARSLAESSAKVAKEKREAEKAQWEAVGQKLSLGAQILGSVKDQTTYDAARATAQQAGLDVTNMPPQYDAAFVQAKRTEGLTTLQQFEQGWKQKGFDLDLKKAEEDARHNRAGEANAAGNLAVSRGQLGVAQGNLAVSQAREAREASAPKGQVVQTDAGPVLVDPRSGTARPVTGADGKPLASSKAPTEFQGKSAAFGARAEQADKILTSLQGKYSPGSLSSKASAESTPLVGGMLAAGMNKFSLSDNDQRAEQAQRDFVNAVLRQESGAAIGASEFENARKQYFPQVGDSAAVIAQKAANRKLAVQGFQVNAGRAAFSAPAAPAAAPQSNGLPKGWSVEVH